MIKFAVAIVKGSEKNIVYTCEAQEDAVAFGENLIKNPTDGLVVVYSSDFDEEGKQISNKEKLYDVLNG